MSPLNPTTHILTAYVPNVNLVCMAVVNITQTMSMSPYGRHTAFHYKDNSEEYGGNE
jgi:hypothetical protein